MANTIFTTNSNIVTLEKGGSVATARVFKTRMLVISGMSQETKSPPTGAVMVT